MTHEQFVSAYRDGRIRVDFDPRRAGQFLSAQLLLPLFMLPVLGIGVALALTGWVWTGLAVIAAGILVPRLIKRGAPQFLLNQALENAQTHDELLRAGIMRVVDVPPN